MSTNNDLKVYLPLEGVDSEHCAIIVDKGLSTVQGVTAHAVELNNRRAVLSVASNDAISAAVQAITNLGYGVTVVHKQFPVLDLSCASCAVSAETLVKAVPGVVRAAVNYGNAMLTVDYLPNMTNPNALQAVVQAGGYDLLIESDEPTETLEEIHTRKLTAIKRKAVWAMIFAAPVFVIGMFFMDMPFANELMLLFTTPVVLWSGQSFFTNAWKQLRHRSANMDTLVALSTGIAYVFSIVAMLFPEWFTSSGLHAHVYFEAAAVIIAFVLLGKLLEEKAKSNTSSAISKLIGLQPKTVTRLAADGSEQIVSIDTVGMGDLLRVKPGESIAVDGVVTTGSSYVDESMLSGEPVPVLKETDSQVFAGTINQKGSFIFKALKVGSETMLANIIKTVQDAQGSKAPVQRYVDKVAAVFVPAVLVIAIVTFFSWLIFGGANSITYALLTSISVLVIACPCALGLATPTAIMVGIGKGAENGILVKDATVLETATNVSAVVLDKTGTITEGKPCVTNLRWHSADTCAGILLAIEMHSEHPLATAVTEHLSAIAPSPITRFESITGKGALAYADDELYLVGNTALLELHNVFISDELKQQADVWSADAQTVIWFSNGIMALAAIAIADTIKSSSGQAIRTLQTMGIETYMLTGDAQATAQAVATAIGIKHYRASMLPDQKAEYVARLQEQGQVVAMAGDGINDSTALATADISIAMGSGSGIAMDVARMTIVSSDLTKIPAALRLSKLTVSTIRQNLFWAFFYNVIGIPIAAGILYPFTGFLLNPMIAGAAMALSSVSVVSNSLRLKWRR